MITAIDHMVILVHNLGQAMEDYGRLGFTVEFGGEHPGGTHNALIAFTDGSYLELIAFKEPDQPSSHPWFDALRHGEGLVAFALGATDLAADAAAIRARGLAVDEPAAGGRLRPDGRRLEWRSAGVGSGPRGRQRPFLIEDVTPREWRVATGRLTRHANGAVGTVDVTLAVANLDRAAAELAAVLDRPAPTPTASGDRRQVIFPLSPGAIVVVQATDASDALAEAVARRGDHVYAVTLGQIRQGGEPDFDPELAHGATLLFQAV